MLVTSIAAVKVGIPAQTLIEFFFARVFSVANFWRHISNLDFRKDTFLNANSYFSFTSLNYPHSRQNPFIWIPVNICSRRRFVSNTS
jgi:hypothetical protein